jgi:hypothetical protein
MNEKFSTRINALSFVVFLLPMWVVLAMLIYIGWFTRLMAEDLCYIYIAEDRGLFRSVWYWYRTWHGAFSVSTVDWLLSLTGYRIIPYVSFIFIAGWIVAAVFAVREGIGRWTLGTYDLLIPLLIGTLLVFTILAISFTEHTLFWWAAARGYLTPLVLFTAYLGLFFRFSSLRLDRIRMVPWLIVSFGLIFTIGGFSETFTPVQFVLFASAIVWIWWADKLTLKNPFFLFLGAGFLGASLSLIVMVLAPGNSIRQSNFPVTPDILTILKVSFGGYLQYLGTIFRTQASLAGILGTIVGAAWLGTYMYSVLPKAGRNRFTNSLRLWHCILPFLVGFILAFGCFPPAVFGTSQPPHPRIWVMSAFFLVGGSLASGLLVGIWARRLMIRSLIWEWVLFVIACFLVTFSSVLVYRNLNSILIDHVEYAILWDRVDEEIRTAREGGQTEVHIPSMKSWGNFQYPSNRPKYWPNVCYSEYYDIQVIAPPIE